MMPVQGWWRDRRFSCLLGATLLLLLAVCYGPRAYRKVLYFKARASECAEIHFLVQEPRTIDEWIAFGHGVLEYIRLYGKENLRRRDVKRQLIFFGRTALMRYRQLFLCEVYGKDCALKNDHPDVLKFCTPIKLYDFRDLETALH